MRSLTLSLGIPLALLSACEVKKDAANDSSTITLSGDAAKNGTASALDGLSNTMDRAANKVDEVSNSASGVRTGLSNLSDSADKFGKSVGHAADSLGDAVDGKHKVEVKTEKNTTTTNTQQ